MDKLLKYLIIIGLIIIVLSSPLGHISTNFYNSFVGNLVGAYELILNGFIIGYRLTGFIISCVGLLEIIFHNR